MVPQLHARTAFQLKICTAQSKVFTHRKRTAVADDYVSGDHRSFANHKTCARSNFESPTSNFASRPKLNRASALNNNSHEWTYTSTACPQTSYLQ